MKLGERGWGWVPREPSRALYNGLASGFKQELLPHLLALLPEPLEDDVISPFSALTQMRPFLVSTLRAGAEDTSTKVHPTLLVTRNH